MSLKSAIARDDEARQQGHGEATRARRRRALRLIGRAAVALTVVGLSAVAAHRAEADSPPCRYTLMGTTVLDNDTGLTWQRANVFSNHFAEAQDHCAGLLLGGQQGWRMPTVQELLTLVDDSKLMPAIDSDVFQNTPPFGFWSSTTVATDPALVWVVSFGEGDTNTDDVIGSTNLVRCVR